MKAIQIHAYGDPDVLRISEVATPQPGPGEVLVRVQASSVNGHDALMRAGAMKIVSGRRFPMGIGLDFTGVVTATGAGADGVVVGATVWGTVHPREKHLVAGAAEYVVVRAERVSAVPAGLSPAGAAALIVPGVTALTALRDATRTVAGERVLVRGAAGGVGTVVVQLAHAMGAEVTALARSAQTAALTDLGASRVLDYRETTPEQAGSYDVIIDTVGSELARFRRRLAAGGRMVTVGLSAPAIAVIAASTVFGPRRIRTFSANPLAPDLDLLAAQVSAGALSPQVAAVFALTEIAAAHRAFERGGVLGRQIVQP